MSVGFRVWETISNQLIHYECNCYGIFVSFWCNLISFSLPCWRKKSIKINSWPVLAALIRFNQSPGVFLLIQLVSHLKTGPKTWNQQTGTELWQRNFSLSHQETLFWFSRERKTERIEGALTSAYLLFTSRQLCREIRQQTRPEIYS